MSKKIVYSGQSFLDKVLECTGSIDNAVQMALLNRISITDDMIVGSELQTAGITNLAIVAFFNENNKPATLNDLMINNNENNFEFPQGEFPISL